jgi:3-oxoacyl-[acyl-carrier protein] reductase
MDAKTSAAESPPAIALITGASGGIGRATALRLAEQGYGLMLSGRDSAKLEQLAEELRQRTQGRCQADFHAADISDEAAVKPLFQQLQQRFGRLDLLVNAVGILLEAPLAMTRSADLQRLFQVNLFASYYCCQFAARLMARQRQGCIINLASSVGEQGAAGLSAYAASKAAISGLTQSLAKELAPLGIRVNAVAPGFIDTTMTAAYQGERRAQVVERTLSGRAGRAEEVAGLIAYLASAEAAYITGQVLRIDGGLQP